MSKHKFPQAPLILGFVLGGILEENLIRGLMYTEGSFLAFFKSPIAATFMLISIAAVIWTIYKKVRARIEKKEAVA